MYDCESLLLIPYVHTAKSLKDAFQKRRDFWKSTTVAGWLSRRGESDPGTKPSHFCIHRWRALFGSGTLGQEPEWCRDWSMIRNSFRSLFSMQRNIVKNLSDLHGKAGRQLRYFITSGSREQYRIEGALAMPRPSLNEQPISALMRVYNHASSASLVLKSLIRCHTRSARCS